MTRLVILDSEAVQALMDPAHRKHRRVIGYAQVVASRKLRGAEIQVVVPTAVRVEAGWDRRSLRWALPNRLRIADVPLAAGHANEAAGIRSKIGVSVTDAHLGALIQLTSADEVTVITSDPGDMRRVAGDKYVTVA